ncbi:unnamed protein product [Brassica oleracea]|uniref:Uncharacterized protein n=1 Tax=Brassica oleracea TaxID=3712 RepID=A0A3P6H7Z3_BRAOL|nr:unnamed protein product [Brassica oleracea]
MVVAFEAFGESSNVMELINTIHSVASVREMIVAELNSGLRNHARDGAIAMRQKVSFCNTQLSILSIFPNALETVGGAVHLAKDVELKNLSSWNDPLDALVFRVQQVGVSGWEQEERLAN